MLRTTLKQVTAAIGILCAASAMAAPHRLAGADLPNVVNYQQHISQTGSSHIIMRVAPLTSSENGFSLSKMAMDVDPGNTLTGAGFSGSTSLPVIPGIAGKVVTKGAALDAANVWVAKSAIATFKGDISKYMGKKGLAQGYINYTQDVRVVDPVSALGYKDQQIVFTMVITSSGKAIYGKPKLIDPNPVVLEINYTPLWGVKGIPQIPSWQYQVPADAPVGSAKPGHLTWRVLNLKLQPISDYFSHDAQGAYDSGPTDANDGHSLGERLACLMDKRKPECGHVPAAVKDVRALLGEYNSTYAQVNYIRSMEPVIEDDAVSGEPVPVSSIAVLKRTWGCDSYHNSGVFGMLMHLTLEQYFAVYDSDAVLYEFVREYNSIGTSPTHAYSKDILISSFDYPGSPFEGEDPTLLVIAPLDSGTGLPVFRVSDRDFMKHVEYVAPLTVDKSFSAGATLPNLSFTPGVEVKVGPDPSDPTNKLKQIIRIGTPGNNYLRDGIHDNKITFNLPNLAMFEAFELVSLKLDDYLRVLLNGTPVINEPLGGSFLDLVTGTPMSGFSGCAKTGSGYTCTEKTKNVSTKVAYNASCPTGTYVDPSYVAPNPTPKPPLPSDKPCFEIRSVAYDHCFNFPSWPGVTPGWHCDSKCPPEKVIVDSSGACHPRERGVNFNKTLNKDLYPLLQQGVNTFDQRLIVGDKGEVSYSIKVWACGATAGLLLEDPNPPDFNTYANITLNKVAAAAGEDGGDGAGSVPPVSSYNQTQKKPKP